MQRLLLTGLSGTGKSAVVAELHALGHHAVDLDCAAYSEWVPVSDESAIAGTPVEPGRDWMWREDRVDDLLAAEFDGPLFVSGCAANMARFLPRFDHVVLLTAPAEVIAARLAARPAGAYGSRPAEVERALGLIDTVEPLLRRAAGHVIDTSGELGVTVAAVLAIA